MYTNFKTGPRFFETPCIYTTGLSLVCCLVIRGSASGFLLLRYFSDVDSHPNGYLQGQNTLFLSISHL